MRIVLALVLVLLSARGLAAQEIRFDDKRLPGIVQAIWKPDGSHFATWGNSPYVEIWRDSDGLRFMVLNHVALMDICPGCKFIDPNAFVSNLRWSDDGRDHYNCGPHTQS